MTINFDNFINIGIVCEGPTEVDFIKVLNKKYFNIRNISLKPVQCGNGKKSLQGNVSIERVVTFLCRNPYGILTTFIDFYGMKKRDGKNVDELEAELKRWFDAQNKNNKIFIPYIQMHETEALWFSDIKTIIKVKNADGNEQQKEELSKIIKKYENPEDINDSFETKPSNRLEKIFNGYDKTVDGNLISQQIEIDTIKEKCPRFREWINKIENLHNI